MIILGTILAKKRGDEPLKLGLDINCLRKSNATAVKAIEAIEEGRS